MIFSMLGGEHGLEPVSKSDFKWRKPDLAEKADAYAPTIQRAGVNGWKSAESHLIADNIDVLSIFGYRISVLLS